MTMSDNSVADVAAAARHARFGKLPERIRYEDMTVVHQVSADGTAGPAYNPEGSWQHFSCLAMDLGL
jgi:hypothetical protein